MKTVFVLTAVLYCCSCKGQGRREPIMIGAYDSLITHTSKMRRVTNKNCIGKSYVSFVIGEKGRTQEVKIIKGLCPEADSIAVEIIRQLSYYSYVPDYGIPEKKIIPVPFYIDE